MADTQRLCVLGGTRFFGRMLVEGLVADGHEVTVVTRGRTAAPEGVTQRVADVTDARALTAAVADLEFDAVVHQLVYTPVAALAAAEAFAGRTSRLVMTSTMEVYNADTFRDSPAPSMSPFAQEHELDLRAYGHDLDRPWHDDGYVDANYGEGRRQAESALAENASWPVAFARVAHVLDATADFTGRVDQHVTAALEGRELTSFPEPGRTSLVSAQDVADFLAWLAVGSGAGLTGAVNAASPDPVSVHEVAAMVEAGTGHRLRIREVLDPVRDEHLSAYSCPRDFGLDVTHAERNGYAFRPVAEWLPELMGRRLQGAARV